MDNLLELTQTELQAVAYFSIAQVCSWKDDKMIIKPIECWTDAQKLCAEVIVDDDGNAIGFRCTDRKLDALGLILDASYSQT